MRLLVPILMMAAAAHADISLQARDAPVEWAEACRRELMIVRDQWNREHPDDLLPEPRVLVQRKHFQWPNILVWQYFFRGQGSGQAQITWREPWSAPLSSKIHAVKKDVNAKGDLHYSIVRGEEGSLPPNSWFPPGSRYGTASAYSVRDDQLVTRFFPVIEMCVRN